MFKLCSVGLVNHDLSQTRAVRINFSLSNNVLERERLLALHPEIMNFLKSLFNSGPDLRRTNSLGLLDIPPPAGAIRRQNSLKKTLDSTKDKFARIKGRYIR